MLRAKLPFLGAFAGAALAAALFTVLVVTEGSEPASLQPPAVQVPPDDPVLRDALVRPASILPTVQPRNGRLGEPGRSGDCQAPEDPAPFDGTQVLSYYGNPYTADMGILGELSPGDLVDRLTEHARLYDLLNGSLHVQPALHLVYATAQNIPYPEGNYLLYVDRATLRQYIDLACENGLLIFLDLQIGRSDVTSEVTRILPFLEQAHVHLGLDPEFAMPEGQVPGQSIGSLDATAVNAAQALLQELVAERGLPPKILVVHRFTEDMLTRPELLEDYPEVRLVIDMDGFGPSEIKRVKYNRFAAPAPYSGIKLFFRQDPDLMSAEDVLELGPDVIIYQ